jgi:hypothetical protein
MKIALGLAGAVLLSLTIGCNVDRGPTQTANEQIDAGKAESVRAEINMGAGELRVEGGSSNLMAASFRYSERIGRPVVRYEVTGAHGNLTVESPKNGSSSGNAVNEWDLKMGSELPLEMNVSLGAGQSTLDMSHISLRSLDVNMGAGQMELNLDGKYKGDVRAEVNGGVGEAKIRLPKDVGVVAEATGGIGGVSTKGLTKRDGKYYNDAYSDTKPALRLQVHGGIGNIELNVGP